MCWPSSDDPQYVIIHHPPIHNTFGRIKVGNTVGRIKLVNAFHRIKLKIQSISSNFVVF
jgi:uncharacterized Zn ribbon protein